MNRIYLIAILILSHITLNAQDVIPPFIACPPNDTVTLPPGGDCTFQYFYAIASSDNEPGDTLVQLAGLESGEGFPLGSTVNVFQAIDAAGNTASCSFTLTVQNYAGPLTCKNDISISLDSTCTWIPGAADLLIGNAGCTDGYYLLEADKTPPYGNGPWVAAEFGPDDLGKTFAFRVSDTTSGYHCIGSVSINDFLPPALTCDSFDISCAVDNVSPYFLRDSLDIAAAVPLAMDACGPLLTFQHQDITVPDSCASNYVGYLDRKWTAQDNFGNTSTCIQRIGLVRPDISDLKYPPDVTVGCDADVSIEKMGQPYLEFAGRKFTNLCQLGAVANDTLSQTTSCSAQRLRVWFVIDWCTGEALEKTQTIDIEDQTGPEFLNCPDSTLTMGDTSATNDSLLWNAPHWLTPQTGMENLCEGPTDLQAITFDACSGSANVRYLLFLDLDNDGTQETVVDSDNPPAAGTVNFGNAGNPNYSGGEPRSFDERPVDSTLKYRFALQKIATGDSSSFRVVWNSDSLPATFAMPQLPRGTHKIKWVAQDSCDNESFCEYNFIVKDNKAPTVTCQSGLVLNLPPGSGCLLTVYAIDFLNDATDNCSPSQSLIFSIRRAGNGAGFPVDGAGFPITNITFSANDLSSQSVELWAQDLAGNAGFCTTIIDFQDPLGTCHIVYSVAGDVKTETIEGVENAKISLKSGTISIYHLTDDQGAFLYSTMLSPGSIYTVTPTKDDNPLNGVSTFDLLLISKHILGLEALGSPYKMIAADANKSNSITTFDVVEFRKLILGIYNELPNNESWRFVPQEYVFPDTANPFQPLFPESITRDIFSDQLDNNFVGIKVGDVNNTVIANDFQTTDERARNTLFFNIKNREVQAGEEFTVPFTAAERMQGWQFTLNTDRLKTLEIVPGEGITQANFAVFENAVTTSVENEATTFSVKFRALQTGQLSEMLAISSRITRAEAYEMDGKIANVALRFDDGATSQLGFELLQNQPNPFSDRTNIGFYLPENADATLTIFDETGRVLFTQSGHYARGYNAVSVEKTSLGATGVLYYKLETPTHNAVRRMVLVK